MRTKAFGMIAMTAVLVSVAIAAVALGPANLANLNGPPGGATPHSSSPIETPTWHAGDTWTYDMNATSPDVLSTTWASPSVVGSVTRTVVSADGSQYNVSLQGSFHLEGLIDFARDADLGNASTMLLSHSQLDNATVDGYAWYRASDLAKVLEVRTVRLSGSVWTEAGTFNASYTAKVETTYDPALDVWSFPLGENETWNVSSNATVRVWTVWHLDGPNVFFDYGRNFTATVPIRLVLMSGAFEDVTTPAGTFTAIPVRIALPLMDIGTTSDPLGFVMGLGNDVFTEPRAPVEAWFSDGAKNVVKAVVLVDGLRVETLLASYHVAA